MLAPGLPREEGSIPPRLSCARGGLWLGFGNRTFNLTHRHPAQRRGAEFGHLKRGREDAGHPAPALDVPMFKATAH